VIRARKGHKFGAVPTVVDGIRFASKAEAKRYGELKMLEKAGKIEELQLQPRYPLYALSRNDKQEVKIGEYRADFQYQFTSDPHTGVIEDVKGMRTPLYNWKKKHFEAQYGIEITEITK